MSTSTPQSREQARIAVLRYLDAAAEAAPHRGIPAAVIRQHLVSDGFGAEAPGTEAILAYLQDKGLVAATAKAISPEQRAWRITAAGRDEYASMIS